MGIFLEAFGYSSEGSAPLRQKNAAKVANDRLTSLRKAKLVLDEERARKANSKKSERRFASRRKPVRGNEVLASLRPTVSARRCGFGPR